jgi:hypothetical protein
MQKLMISCRPQCFCISAAVDVPHDNSAVVGIPTVTDILVVAGLFSAVSAAVHSTLLPLNLLSSNPMF